MGQRLRRNAEYLQLLCRSRGKARQRLVANATPEQINALSEVAMNVLRGNLPLSSVHKRKLVPHRHRLRQIANRKLSSKKRKALMVRQRGGFLIPALLGGLASIFAPKVINKLISKI